MISKRQTEGRISISPKLEIFSVPSFLHLPPELRAPIISKLSVEDALALRLTCQTLNIEVLAFYSFQMNITGDTLNFDQLTFLNRINLKRITFKRIGKPFMNTNISPSAHTTDEDNDDLPLWYPESMSPSWTCTRKKIYSGPCQYLQVGGIQIRSLSAPKKIVRYFRCTPTSKSRSHGLQQSEHKVGGKLREKVVYDYACLKNYILSVSSDDIFKHI